LKFNRLPKIGVEKRLDIGERAAAKGFVPTQSSRLFSQDGSSGRTSTECQRTTLAFGISIINVRSDQRRDANRGATEFFDVLCLHRLGLLSKYLFACEKNRRRATRTAANCCSIFQGAGAMTLTIDLRPDEVEAGLAAQARAK